MSLPYLGKILPNHNDIDDLKRMCEKVEWFMVPIVSCQIVLALWPIAWGTLAYLLYKKVQQK